MSEGLFLVVAAIAGLACPAHMWWQHRRGRQAACCPPGRDSSSDVEALRVRQQWLANRIAERHAADEAARR